MKKLTVKYYFEVMQYIKNSIENFNKETEKKDSITLIVELMLKDKTAPETLEIFTKVESLIIDNLRQQQIQKSKEVVAIQNFLQD